MIFGKSTSANAAATLETARANLAKAEAAAEAAETAYRSNLAVLEIEDLEKLAATKSSATVALDRARAVLEAAEIRHGAAIEADAEAERLRRYDAAAKLSEAAAKRLRREYPKAAQAIRDLLRELAEAETAVREANAELPEGKPQIVKPEDGRSLPTLHREDVGEEVVDLWTTIDSNSPIADDLQSNVQRRPGRTRGMLTDRSDTDENPLKYGLVETEHGTIEVVQKRFSRTKFLPQENGRTVAPLATEIVLPPLDAGASAFWTPTANAIDSVRQAGATLQPQPSRPAREPAFEHSLVKR